MDAIELHYEARLWADRIRPEYAEQAREAIDAADRELRALEEAGRDTDALQPKMVRLVGWLERRARDTQHGEER